MPTYTIPAKPKTDDGHLELIAKIVFVIGFNYKVVEQRWPQIRKAFHGFDIKKVARASEDKILSQPGMIRNRRKVQAIIRNAQECERIVKEHGSMREWVGVTGEAHRRDPLFSPSFAEECERRFTGIGKTTREWVAYVFAKGKSRPEKRVVRE